MCIIAQRFTSIDHPINSSRSMAAPAVAGGSSQQNLTSSSGSSDDKQPSSSSPMECQLKKYLVLLATLVATVTYAAGLNPPGGSWLEDGGGGGRWQLAGDAILQDTNYWRYIVFYWFNAISFAASLVVSLLFLLLHKGRPPPAPGDQAAHAHPGGDGGRPARSHGRLRRRDQP